MPGKNPTRGSERSERAWTLKDIQELLDVLAGREITEFEMEQDGVKIRIRRGSAQAANPGNPDPYLSAPPASAASPVVLPPPVTHKAASPSIPPPSEPASEPTDDLFVMKSPIVGTFYAAPAPNAPPFVQIGDIVQVGQVLCIIEAMKLMNELESEVAGEVMRIYAENGQPLEYGQSLFAIKPSNK